MLMRERGEWKVWMNRREVARRRFFFHLLPWLRFLVSPFLLFFPIL